MKTLISTVIGFLSGAAGITLLYLFLKSLNDGANIIFLVLFLILFGVSLFCIIMATRPKKSDPKLAVDSTIAYEKTLKKLEENTATLQEWEKTNEQRDKLKLLKMAGAAEEESEKA